MLTLKDDRLNSKVAADGRGRFRFKWPFLHLISAVFHVFLKIRI